MPEKDFRKLAAAMTVNGEFREMVLNPQTRESTITEGYSGITFGFTPEEFQLLMGIKTKNQDPVRGLGEFWRIVNNLRGKG